MTSRSVLTLLALTGPVCLAAAPVNTTRVAYLAGDLPDEQLIVLSAALAASGRPDVLLLNTPEARAANADFLAAWRPDEVVRVGTLDAALWGRLLPRARVVVVCPPEPRRLLLQAACLAGAAGGPLCVSSETDLQRRVRDWKAERVLAVGTAERACRGLEGVTVTRLADEAAVVAAHREQLVRAGGVPALVVSNPTDRVASALAPWVALRKGGALLLTEKDGKVEPTVRAALRDDRLKRAEHLVLVGGPGALPTERRPNPAAGKDDDIEMEPLTPRGRDPFTFATGRLAHPDRGVLALLLARQRLLADRPHRALVVSNSGGGLPLLEVMSRQTVQELTAAGYRTTLLAGKGVKPGPIRKALPSADLFIWEGHYKTLTEEFGFGSWTEPLPPVLFLQTCLALNEKESAPLLTRGGVALVGSSSRVYSGTGGAFTLAFFDAVLYDDQSLGGSLRQAKNFLLAYSLLKQSRLKEAPLGGANLRSAWAFTLLGDPTIRLPRPAPRTNAVRHTVEGDELVLHLPSQRLDEVSVGEYRAHTWPNGRLAGLLRKEDEGRRLVPLAFTEVRLPGGPEGKEPRLTTRLPDDRWVFLWDERLRVGSLLVMPRGGERRVRFHVEWQVPDRTKRPTPASSGR